MLAVYLVLYPAVVSLGVHVICGVVLFTPSGVHDASVAKAVLDTGISISVIATDVILIMLSLIHI